MNSINNKEKGAKPLIDRCVFKLLILIIKNTAVQETINWILELVKNKLIKKISKVVAGKKYFIIYFSFIYHSLQIFFYCFNSTI